MNSVFPGNSYQVFLFLGILFILFWIYTVLWVAKDISWRTNSLRFQVFSIVLVALVTPLLGLPVYFLMRPVQRFDTKEFKKKPHNNCQSCGEENEIGHEFCTLCGDKITIECIGCDNAIPVTYLYCPFCGSPRSKVF